MPLSRRSKPRGKGPKAICAIRNQLIQNFAAPASLKKLAASTHMSESKLNRSFKQVFGHSLGSYHQKSRIYRAAELIRYRHYFVTAAAFTVGFSNVSHFSRILPDIRGKPKIFSAE
ncbi:helix-turn-helix transcriptional regulator [Mucilaginibacter pedocola]|uniref:helix-turn-helix transcriptional regulator n=1 Tax=Mucilaginibacter pedocola TaxID=1792845 RepID=UPI0009927F3C